MNPTATPATTAAFACPARSSCLIDRWDAERCLRLIEALLAAQGDAAEPELVALQHRLSVAVRGAQEAK